MRGVESLDPIPDGHGLLHIGPPKTGTSALQAALHASRSDLLDHGVDYVSRRPNALAAARHAVGRGTGDTAARERRWARLAERFRSSTQRHALLSSEGFAHADLDEVRAIHAALGSDTHVLIALRPRAEWLPSAWQQSTRMWNTRGWEEWLHDALSSAPGTGPLRPLDPVRLLETWGSVFGEERLVFLAPHPTDRTTALRAVEALLGLPEVLTLQPTTNASLGFAETEVLRHFHLASERTDDSATWRRTLRRSGKQLEAATRGHTDVQRIRVPRWAAAEANRADAEARAALEASRATVVGDLARLAVDPADFSDRADVPTQVDVTTAGLIAHTIAAVAAEEFSSRTTSTPPQGQVASGPPTPSLDDLSTADLVRALASRLRPRQRPESSW